MPGSGQSQAAPRCPTTSAHGRHANALLALARLTLSEPPTKYPPGLCTRCMLLQLNVDSYFQIYVKVDAINYSKLESMGNCQISLECEKFASIGVHCVRWHRSDGRKSEHRPRFMRWGGIPCAKGPT